MGDRIRAHSGRGDVYLQKKQPSSPHPRKKSKKRSASIIDALASSTTQRPPSLYPRKPDQPGGTGHPGELPAIASKSDVAGAAAEGGLASDAIAPGARPSARGSLGAENRGSVIRRSVCSHIRPRTSSHVLPGDAFVPAGLWTSGRRGGPVRFPLSTVSTLVSPRLELPFQHYLVPTPAASIA
jgi:hypothetical protein